jgi:hypothetical protein
LRQRNSYRTHLHRCSSHDFYSRWPRSTNRVECDAERFRAASAPTAWLQEGLPMISSLRGDERAESGLSVWTRTPKGAEGVAPRRMARVAHAGHSRRRERALTQPDRTTSAPPCDAKPVSKPSLAQGMRSPHPFAPRFAPLFTPQPSRLRPSPRRTRTLGAKSRCCPGTRGIG